MGILRRTWGENHPKALLFERYLYKFQGTKAWARCRLSAVVLGRHSRVNRFMLSMAQIDQVAI